MNKINGLAEKSRKRISELEYIANSRRRWVEEDEADKAEAWEKYKSGKITWEDWNEQNFYRGYWVPRLWRERRRRMRNAYWGAVIRKPLLFMLIFCQMVAVVFAGRE